MLNRRWLTFVFIACALMVLTGYAAIESRRVSATEYQGTALENPGRVSEITLISMAGRSSLSDWRGQYLLVFFGFTECPDVCPLTLGRLARIYRDLGEPDAVQVVMVSVNPETETPARVGQYVESFHPSFVGLTGSSSDIAKAARTFFVGYRQLDKGVGHTDAVALSDPEGRMRLIFRQDNVARIGYELEKILSRGRLYVVRMTE